MSGDGKRYLFDKPANVRRVIQGLLAVCLVLVGLDLVIHRHVVHPWEGVFGFYAMYGFVGCVVLVLMAKGLRRIVMRTEDYYDPATGYPPDEEKGEEKGDA